MNAQTLAAWTVAGLVVLGAGVTGALQTDGRTADAAPPAPSPSPAASPSPAPEPTASPANPVETAQLAAVNLSGPCEQELCPFGSGSVVDPSGLILTNAHVAAPTAPGLAGKYANQAENPVDPDYLVVSLPPTPEADAVPLYRASLVAADGYADLAVLKVDAELDGSPLTSPPVLTTVPLGALAETKKDSEVRVIGYPTSGDSLSPTVTRGTVASKPVDERVEGPWELNTDALIHGGNSGGMVIDEQGRLIAIPTYRTGGEEQVYRARAVELARPLLDAARAGRPYVSPHLVPATGDEELLAVDWSDQPLGNACVGPGSDGAVFVAPEMLDLRAEITGLALGEDFRLVVTDPAGTAVSTAQEVWRGVGCVGLSVEGFEGYTLEPGTWTLTAYVGPASVEVGSSSVEVLESEPAG